MILMKRLLVGFRIQIVFKILFKTLGNHSFRSELQLFTMVLKEVLPMVLTSFLYWHPIDERERKLLQR